MKKFLMALGLTAVLSAPAVFANEFVVEPESDTAVSFAAYDTLSGEWETTFVNYAKADGDDEYWIRVAMRKGIKEKVLHYATLIVDGERYRLTAVPIDDKHFYAAQSITMNPTHGLSDPALLFATWPRYFPVSRDIALKLINAKEVKIIYNRVGRINTCVTVNNRMLEDIHKAYSLRYADFNNYWKPNDSKQQG